MNRLSYLLALLTVYGVAGCGFGGGSGGGGSIAPIGSGPPGPVVSGSYIPTKVYRATNYTWGTVYTANQAAGGSISAIGVAPTTTECWVGVAPLGRADHLAVDGTITTGEGVFVFDVSSFAIINSNVYATTSNSIANYAGAVYARDLTGMWQLSLAGSLKESVALNYANQVLAFQGENDGRSATVSSLDSSTGMWTNIAALGSFVPAAASAYNGESWVGGRSARSAGGPAMLFHGNASMFNPLNVPQSVFPGQIASIQALAVANNVLFVAVEVRDAIAGTTVAGTLYYLDTKGLVSINQMLGDAPVCLAAADGTIYAGTRNGKLFWLDEKGKWNQETTLPANIGVTAVAWNGKELVVGIRSNQGAQLLHRIGQGTVPPPPPGGFSFTSISPNMGAPAGGTSVTITGNGFATVTVVKIGGVPLSNLKVVSDTTLTGTTGAGTAGPANVDITSMTKGTITASGAFTYVQPLTYATDIMPILQVNCTIAGCHVTGGAAAAYTLTPRASLLAAKSAANVPYVVAGNVNGSWLAQKIDAKVGTVSATMAIHLTATQATTIENWIAQGAN